MPVTLIIRHIGKQDGKPQFNVVRMVDGKVSDPVCLTPPEETFVEGRPDSNLQLDLRWYLEKFLDYPFEPNTDTAERVLGSLKDWGINSFSQLFGAGQARDWYQDARRSNESFSALNIKIASDDPRILAWPWEALRDPEGTTLAHTCRIERQLRKLHDPLPLPDNLPRDRINILLVIARPYGDSDVGYHALSRPLVELIHKDKKPLHIDVLRPPTFEKLREMLHEKPGFYHIVHFDGHGGYGSDSHAGSPHSYQDPQGRLVFETEDGNADAVEAEQLTQLLAEYRIPIMVLNACQSARIDEHADDPFASVAAALLKAGIRSVVAMDYNLHVSGAQQFVPAFYQRLIDSGDVAEAVRFGRQAMRAKDLRICARGEFPLQDWLVPVLYQQEPVELPVLTKGRTETDGKVQLPKEATELGDYGFIGRQNAVHTLERAMQRQKQAALLIHGMAGVGKTTLAKGFLQWLRDTNGLGADALWFSFDDIRNAEYVINRLVEAIFASNANAQPLDKKLDALISTLRENPFLIIWDNFESAAGIEGTEVTPLLLEEDRQLLKEFLQKLRGGKTKVLITSRSPEEWLSVTECYRIPIGGLTGEECWEYCNMVVSDLGLSINRNDKTFSELMDMLDGHPLAMRAILLRLQEKSAVELLKDLKEQFEGTKGDESTSKIFAALTLLNQGMPADFAPVFQLIGLHQRYVVIDYVEKIFRSMQTGIDRNLLDSCFPALVKSGLLHDHQNGVYRMHPALSGFLRANYPANESMETGFVDFMGSFADQLAPKKLHEKRTSFMLYGANLHYALELAKRLKMNEYIAALTQSLASFAENTRDFVKAKRLYESLVEHNEKTGHEQGVAVAYHQLGINAQEQHDFITAEQWYKKSLTIFERLDDEHGAASTYHQLGMIAEQQRDFTAAEKWYKKSLEISERHGNEHGVALTYGQLGVVAQEQRNFIAAEQWHKKSLAIEEKQGNEHGAAITYHQLGRIAEEQRNFKNAVDWYKKSLEIEEKQGNEHGAAITYHQLGMIAQEQRDFAVAENWYKKSLAIKEKQGNEHGAAITYGQLGISAQEQRDFENAGKWFIKAILIFKQTADEYYLKMTTRNFALTMQTADENIRTTLKKLWNEAGLDELITIDELEKQLNDRPPLTNNLNDSQTVNLIHTLAAADPEYAAIEKRFASLPASNLPSTEQITLARETVEVLIETPQQEQAIKSLLKNPAQRFDSGLISAGTLVAILFLLRTNIKFKYKSDKSGEFQIEHKPSDSKALTQLLNKLSALLPTPD